MITIIAVQLNYSRSLLLLRVAVCEKMDVFRATTDPSWRRAVTTEPFRLVTTNDLGWNGVDSFPILRYRMSTTSPMSTKDALVITFLIVGLRLRVAFGRPVMLSHYLIVRARLLYRFWQFRTRISAKHYPVRCKCLKAGLNSIHSSATLVDCVLVANVLA